MLWLRFLLLNIDTQKDNNFNPASRMSVGNKKNGIE